MSVRRSTLGALSLAAALLVGFAMCAPLPLLADERFHVAQIRLLMQGRWELVPLLTTIPGYHALLAVAGHITGRGDVTALRLYSFALSIAALITLFALARQARDDRAIERILQIALLPMLFPLLFLVYTDVAALLFFELALLMHEKGRHWIGAACATAALAVRQNYVVWFGFLALLLAIDVVRRHSRIGPAFATQGAGYAAGLALFAVFVVWNGGVAIGDRAMHPFPSVHLGNVYFTLLLAFIVLLPLHVTNARRIVSRLRRPVTLLLLVVLLPMFLATFRVDHPYNQPDLSWWLHNALLTLLVSSLWMRLLLFALMAVALLSLTETPLRERPHYLVYPFAIASLVPAWQIEPRYSLVPIVLLQLFRVQQSLRVEWMLIGYLALVTGMLFLGLSRGAYFL